VVYEVVEDAVWGIFGKNKHDAQYEFFKEWAFKTTDKGGHLRYTKSDQFIIIKRGLVNKRLKKMERKGTKETPARPTEGLYRAEYFKRNDMVRVLDPSDEYNLRSGLVTEIYEHGALIEVKFVDDVRKKYSVDQLKIVSSATMRPKEEEEIEKDEFKVGDSVYTTSQPHNIGKVTSTYATGDAVFVKFPDRRVLVRIQDLRHALGPKWERRPSRLTKRPTGSSTRTGINTSGRRVRCPSARFPKSRESSTGPR
jgi:hypothetical protein